MKSFYGCLNYYHNNCNTRLSNSKTIIKEIKNDNKYDVTIKSRLIKIDNNLWNFGLPTIFHNEMIKYIKFPFANYQKYFKN